MSKQKEIIRLQLQKKNTVENYVSGRCVKQQAIPIYCFIINDLIDNLTHQLINDKGTKYETANGVHSCPLKIDPLKYYLKLSQNQLNL